MNIFEVLSRGKSRLHEPSISAMLGYLLDTHKDHGLGDTFLRAFLELVYKQTSDSKIQSLLFNSFIDTEISLEEPYQLGDSRKDIDIQIVILDKEKNELYRIIIENKIKTGAANPKQLSEYYRAVLEDDEKLENLVIIFLTPKASNLMLQQEFEAASTKPRHHKVWLYWNDEEKGILNIIRSILGKESTGEINPINEYMKHTLKAFVLHINSVVNQQISAGTRYSEDIGELVDEVNITLSDNVEYKILRRNSQQIQVFVNDEKVTAKPVLRKIIEEKNLNIPTLGITTRQMGKKVIEAIRNI